MPNKSEKKKLNKFALLRIARLKKKFIDLNLIKSVVQFYSDSKKIIKTKSRSSVILPIFNKLTINVYNGKKYIPLEITNDFIGHKFGEFVLTRKFLGHKKDNKKLVFKKKLITKDTSFSHTRVPVSLLHLSKKLFIKNEKKN